MIIVYCLIVETVLVLIPMFIMHKKTKKDKAATSTTLSTDNSQQKETQLPIV
jgi:hypothetical protein